MTAEIVIINQQAVALAADSAVTIGRNKVWKHANKLFSFGPYNDIGIMIYNSGEFLGVPWEVIVKEFRVHVANRAISTLRQFADEFVEFVKSAKFSDPHSETLSFGLVFSDVIDQLFADLEYNNRNDMQLAIIAAIKINESELINLNSLTCPFSYETFARKYRSLIAELAKDELKFSMRRGITERLTQFMFELVSLQFESGYSTGVVIAGYGQRELFPSVYHQIFDGKSLEMTRTWKADKCHDLNETRRQGGAIIPFAQSDMAHLFVEGIAPQYLRFLAKTFLSVLKKRSHEIVDNLANDPDQRLVEKALQDKQTASMNRAFGKAFREFRRKAFVNPILETIQALPKEEMAYMARAMVEITALRRRFASTVESVGGEIDVAVISKSDGFIWINRKHYFDLDKNRDFMERKTVLRGVSNAFAKQKETARRTRYGNGERDKSET